MKKSKFFKVLISLDSDQFYKLEYYLIHIEKARTKCVQFYNAIKQRYIEANNSWDKIIIDKQSIHHQLFKKPYSSKSSSLREISSEFFKHLLNYCAFIQFERDKERYILRYLNEKSINDLFEKAFNSAYLKIKSVSGLENLWHSIELNELYAVYEAKNDLPMKIDLEEVLFNFNNFSLIKNLALYCVLLQNSITRNLKVDQEISASIDVLLKSKKIKSENKLLFNMYKQTIQLLKGEKTDYKVLKNKLHSNASLIAKQDLFVLINSLICFCNLQIKKKSGNLVQYFWTEVQSNYFYMYNAGLLNDGAYVPTMHIKNICLLSIRRINEKSPLKLSLKKVLAIIEESKQKTIPQYRESTFHFNMGSLFYYTNNFEEAISYFEAKFDYANKFFFYSSKFYLLRSYYLTGKSDAFYKLIASFRQALRRDSFLSRQDKRSYKNSIKAFVKLQKIKQNIQYEYRYKPKSEIEKLIDYLEVNPLNLNNWFIEQLNQLQT